MLSIKDTPRVEKKNQKEYLERQATEWDKNKTIRVLCPGSQVNKVF